MQRNSPFFLIGNARFEVPAGEPTFQNRCVENNISAETETHEETTLHHQDVTIVDLVESRDGSFSFVPRDVDPILPPCQTPSIIGKSNTFYIHNRALGQLDSFATLLGRCDIKLGGDYSNGQCDKSDLAALEDDAVRVLYTLLPVAKLFAWYPLLQARIRGDITWAGIRALLAIARMNVPFLTKDGILKHILADQITFTQFIVFSELLRVHLQSAACLKDSLKTARESITDIIPPFENLASSGDMIVELVASTKDKEVRKAAISSGITVPVTKLSSLDDCSQDWTLYTSWWKSSKDTRNDFCLRELEFTAKDPLVRRHAKKARISMRGIRSKDPACLIKFGLWYFGPAADSQSPAAKNPEEEDDLLSLSDEQEIAEEVNFFCLPVRTYDSAAAFETGSNPIVTIGCHVFQNHVWKPRKDINIPGQGDCKPAEPTLPEEEDFSDLFLSGPKPQNQTEDEPKCDFHTRPEPPTLLGDVATEYEEGGPLNTEDDTDMTTKVDSADRNSSMARRTTNTPSRVIRTAGAGSHVVTVRTSFRMKFLSRLSAKIDNASGAVSLTRHWQNSDHRLKGIGLFRLKVRHVMVLLRLTANPNFIQQLEAATQEIDIFTFDSSLLVPKAKPKPPKTVPPEPEEPPVDDEADISRADSYFNKTLSKHTLTSWFQQAQERLRQLRMLQEQASLADTAYNKRLMTTALRMFQEYAYLQKKAREQEPPPNPVEDTESELIAEESASESEPEQVEEAAADPAPTSIDDVDREKYNMLFARAILMDSILDRNRKQATFLQEGTLRQMKAERWKGKENIFSVPNEYVYPEPKPRKDPAYVDFRKEVART